MKQINTPLEYVRRELRILELVHAKEKDVAARIKTIADKCHGKSKSRTAAIRKKILKLVLDIKQSSDNKSSLVENLCYLSKQLLPTKTLER